MRVHFFDTDAAGVWRLVSLSEGETVESSHSSTDEEGYSRTYQAWSLEDGIVTCRFNTDATDCDGRFFQSYASHCPVAHLADREVNDGETGAPLPFRAPAWREDRSSQRDYRAESCGY